MHGQQDMGRGPVRSLRGASDTGAAGLPLNRSLDYADRQVYTGISIHKPDEMLSSTIEDRHQYEETVRVLTNGLDRPNSCLFLTSTETMDFECGFTCKKCFG